MKRAQMYSNRRSDARPRGRPVSRTLQRFTPVNWWAGWAFERHGRPSGRRDTYICPYRRCGFLREPDSPATQHRGGPQAVDAGHPGDAGHGAEARDVRIGLDVARGDHAEAALPVAAAAVGLVVRALHACERDVRRKAGRGLPRIASAMSALRGSRRSGSQRRRRCTRHAMGTAAEASAHRTMETLSGCMMSSPKSFGSAHAAHGRGSATAQVQGGRSSPADSRRARE